MTAATLRLNRLPGGLVDRSRPVRGCFDGQPVNGFSGDTLASALLANGIRLVGRSFKYHRPRGILTAGPEEPNALVELRSGARREPNSRATTTEMYNGLEAMSQNRWPSLRFDILSLNSILAPLLAAGFYYKTFMWPASFWERIYEPLIRNAAGLGRAASLPDPDHYEHAFAFCDVLIVGSGPAGLAAARVASRAGGRIILCEQDFLFGGRLLADGREIDGVPGHIWAQKIVDELRSCPDVRLMPRTCVFGVYDGSTYGALERVADHMVEPPPHQPRQRLWRIVAKRAVLATGAIERPLVFGGNDRPGVMMASAVRGYVNRFAVQPGKRFALFTNNDDGWRTAKALSMRGIEVAAIIDSRSDISAHLTAQCPDTRIIVGGHVVSTKANPLLRSITVRSPTGTETIEADTLAMSGGWNPDVGLTCHHNGRPSWKEDIAAFVPNDVPRGLIPAGSASGRMLLRDCLADGFTAGRRASDEAGFKAAEMTTPLVDHESCAVTPLWHVSGGQGLRRLSERRYDRRHSTGRTRGIPLRRTSQALHDARDGDRPRQTVECQWSRDHGRVDRQWNIGDRHDELPPALLPCRDRGSGRSASRPTFPPDPPHTVASVGKGTKRNLRGDRTLAARPVFPAPRRTGLA
jgi:sarcosine oxidase subunit alpha